MWIPFLSRCGSSHFWAQTHLPKAVADLLHMASFGHLSEQIWIKPFLNPITPSQSCCKSVSIWLNLDTFLSRSRSSHFRVQIHLLEARADLIPYGFIWTPFCSDFDQAIFKSRYTFPKLWLIWFHMASFGHLLCRLGLPFSSPDTPSQSYCGFDSICINFD